MRGSREGVMIVSKYGHITDNGRTDTRAAHSCFSEQVNANGTEEMPITCLV